MFGSSGFRTMAPPRYAAKFDPFLSLDCAPTPSTLAQSKERKGSNFAIWHPCHKAHEYLEKNWSKLKSSAERKWREGKRSLEEMLKQAKDAIKRARSVMRKVPYYWKMIKATRGFIRGYGPAPNRILEPHEESEE